MSTFEHIIVESKGAVGIITLNRPKLLNALSFGVFREIAAAVDDLEADDSIGCILVTGSEKAFAAGADIKEMQPKGFIDMFSSDFAAIGGDRVARCRKPTIAAVAGYALGGGCDLAKHAERQRIEHLRPVQLDDADRALAFNDDVLERAHGSPAMFDLLRANVPSARVRFKQNHGGAGSRGARCSHSPRDLADPPQAMNMRAAEAIVSSAPKPIKIFPISEVSSHTECSPLAAITGAERAAGASGVAAGGGALSRSARSESLSWSGAADWFSLAGWPGAACAVLGCALLLPGGVTKTGELRSSAA